MQYVHVPDILFVNIVHLNLTSPTANILSNMS